MEETVKLEIEFDTQSAEKAGREATRAADRTSDRESSRGSRQRSSPQRSQTTPRWEREQAQKDRLAYQTHMANARTPAERLKLLRDELKNAPAGSVARYRAELDLTREENRQKNIQERRTIADRVRAERQQKQQELAEKRRQQREAKAEEKLLNRRDAAELRMRARARDKANPMGMLGEVLGGDRRSVDGISRLIGSGRLGAIGRFAGPVAGIFGGMQLAGAGARTMGSAMTGNASGMIQGGLQGVQAVGTTLMAFGPAGIIAGAAIKALGAAASKTAELLESLTEALAPYSAKASMALAELDVRTEAFKARMAVQTEGVMVAWAGFKTSLLNLAEKLMPLVQPFIDNLTKILDAMSRFSDGLSVIGNKLSSVAGYWMPGGSSILQAQAGPSGEDAFRSMNMAMLNDLNVNGGATSPYSNDPNARTGTPTTTTAAQYRAPGGGGLQMVFQQSIQQQISDQSAIDRGVEMIRQRMSELISSAGSRLDMAMGMLDSQTGIDLTA